MDLPDSYGKNKARHLQILLRPLSDFLLKKPLQSKKPLSDSAAATGIGGSLDREPYPVPVQKIPLYMSTDRSWHAAFGSCAHLFQTICRNNRTPRILQISCAELRELADANPDELEVIVEMMIEAEAELCADFS